LTIAGVSQAIYSRDLAAMVEAGILLAGYKTRTRIYGPNPKYFFAEQQVPAEQPPLIPKGLDEKNSGLLFPSNL